MQRVLVVAFSVVPAPDRHSVQLINAIKALAPRYTVDVVTVKSADLPYVDRFMRTRMLRVPVGTGSLAEQIEVFRRAVRRQLEGVDYDVVHFRCPWGGRPVCERKGELGARMVFEVARSPEGDPMGSDRELVSRLARDERFCLERADQIIASSEAGAAYLRRRGLGSRIEVMRPGVDIDEFDWEPAAELDPPRVLYVGRVGPARGVRLMLEAAALVARVRPLQLCLAGSVDPGFDEHLVAAVASLGLERSVKVLGAVEHADLPRLLSTATVCVAPHAADERDRPLAPCPAKILEYMACRRPVVAPRRVAVAELLREGEEGLLFNPGDARDLAARVLELLDNRDLRQRIAEAGYRAARERHPASAARRRLLEIYARLAPLEAWTPSTPPPAPLVEIPASPESTTARRSFLAATSDSASGELTGLWDETKADLPRPEPPNEDSDPGR
jgi:glycosyltransferase involved in cell wall biosynthesis